MKKVIRNLEVFVLAVGVVFVWRGVWGLSDIYILPNNEPLSYIISILIGVVILYIHKRNLKELS